MASLVRLASGYDFLLPLPEPERGYQRAQHGASFEEYDTSGFDECFPTVAACEYSVAGLGTRMLPDHGDLWSVPWEAEARDGQLALEVEGRSLPYRFRKRVRLEGSDLVLDYEIENTADVAYHYVWSAHPLLRVEPGARVLLPPNVEQMLVHWSRDDRLGKAGATCGWPVARQQDGEEDDLSQLKPAHVERADKLFTPRLKTGGCALFLPGRNESVALRFDPLVVPYVGLWLCQAGWPTTRAAKHYTVALEPTNGRTDSLLEAVANSSGDRLEPRQVRRWTLRFELRPGPPSLASLSRGTS